MSRADGYFDFDATGTVQYPFTAKWCVDGTIAVMMSSVIQILDPQFRNGRIHDRQWLNIENEKRGAIVAPIEKKTAASVKRWLLESQSADCPYGPACFRCVEWSTCPMPGKGCVLAVLMSDGNVLLAEIGAEGGAVRFPSASQTVSVVGMGMRVCVLSHLTKLFAHWSGLLSCTSGTLDESQDRLAAICWLDTVCSVSFSSSPGEGTGEHPCLLLAVSSPYLLMIWALSPYFESGDDGEGGQYKCAPIFAVSLDQLAAQVSETLQVHKPLKAQSFGSVKSICSVPRGTSEREEGVLCSLLVGTSSGYLILVDLMSTNTSLVPATVSSASSQASERSLVPVQSVHSSIRWCHRVSSSALAQLLCVGGDTGEIAIGVQCGQQCLLLPLSGPSVSDKQLIGGERQMMGSVGSGIVSSLSLLQQLGSDGESGMSPFSLIAGTVDGVIHRWTCSLSESRMTECFPSFPLLACGPVISGLCVDPLNFMGTCVSKSTDNSKRFGNPLVQRVCLAPLPGTSLTSLRDIATLTLVLRRVLNRVAVAPHVSLASLLMFLKYELSRLSDPLRQRHFPETETRTTVRGTDDSITIVEALSMGADSIGCEGLGEVNGSSGGDQGSSFTALLDPPQGLDRKRKTLPVEESCSLKGREEIEDADEEEDFVQALQTIANTSFLPPGREFHRAGGGGGSSAGGLVSAGDGAVMLAQAMLRAAASLCGHDSGVEAEELTGGLMGEQEDVAYCVRAATALLRIPSDPHNKERTLTLWRCVHSTLCGLDLHSPRGSAIGHHSLLSSVARSIRGGLRLLWTETFLNRAVDFFRVVEFESCANANVAEDGITSPGGHWSDAFRIPSLREVRSIYLTSQWLFSFAGWLQEQQQQQQQPEVNRLVPLSVNADEALRLQRMGLDCLVYAERVRVLFYSSVEEGCGSRCEVCSHCFSAADLHGNEESGYGLVVPCPSCGVHTELCSRTLLPLSALPSHPDNSDAASLYFQLNRRCSLCTSPVHHPHVTSNYGSNTEFMWLSEDRHYPVTCCMYCSLNMAVEN